MVLQHYPSAELISSSTMNWKGRFISAVLDGLCSIGLKRFAQASARLAGLDPEMIGKTWRGVPLTSDDVEKMVGRAGGVPEGFDGLDSPFAWCYGRRGSQANS
jgi:hypothetical protein